MAATEQISLQTGSSVNMKATNEEKDPNLLPSDDVKRSIKVVPAEEEVREHV